MFGQLVTLFLVFATAAAMLAACALGRPLVRVVLVAAAVLVLIGIPLLAAADDLRLVDRSGRTVYVVKDGTIVRDRLGNTVARVARQFGSRNLVVRDVRGRTIARIKAGRK